MFTISLFNSNVFVISTSFLFVYKFRIVELFLRFL